MRWLLSTILIGSLFAPAVARAQDMVTDHREYAGPDAVEPPPWWTRSYLRPDALHEVEGFRYPPHALDPVPELIDDQETLDAGYRVAVGTWTTGIESMTLPSGSNEWHVSTGGAVGWQDAAATATVAGPIRRDHAWVFAGTAPRVDGGWTALPWAAKIAAAPDADLIGEVWSLGAATSGVTRELHGAQLAEPVAFTQLTAAAGNHWLVRFDDGHGEIRLGLAAYRDRLDFQQTTQDVAAVDERAAGRLSLVHRRRALGYHWLALGVEQAIGSADDPLRARSLSTRELSLFAGDTWQLTPSWTLDAGIRWDAQRARTSAADDRDVRDAYSPRVGLIWDFSREGRSKLFAHWGRYWRPATIDALTPDHIDEATTGIEYEVIDDVVAGAAAVHRDGSPGFRLHALSRLDWLHAGALFDSDLGLELTAAAPLFFLTRGLVGGVRVHTDPRVPSSLRIDYHTMLAGERARWSADVLLDGEAPDVRMGLSVAW